MEISVWILRLGWSLKLLLSLSFPVYEEWLCFIILFDFNYSDQSRLTLCVLSSLPLHLASKMVFLVCLISQELHFCSIFTSR